MAMFLKDQLPFLAVALYVLVSSALVIGIPVGEENTSVSAEEGVQINGPAERHFRGGLPQRGSSLQGSQPRYQDALLVPLPPSHDVNLPHSPLSEALFWRHGMANPDRWVRSRTGPSHVHAEPLDLNPLSSESVSLGQAAPVWPTDHVRDGTNHDGSMTRAMEGESSSSQTWVPLRFEPHREVPRRMTNNNRYREPSFLKRLTYTTPPIRPSRQGFVRYDYTGDNVRDLINTRIFKGKLIWVDPNEFPKSMLKTQRTQAFRLNRVLPWLKTDDPRGGPKRRVRMSVHGGTIGERHWPRDHWLRSKTYYTFWGLPDFLPARGEPVFQKHGIGYLDPQHHDEVDEFLEATAEAVSERVRGVV